MLLLLSDSTYAEVPGYTPSEQVVGEALDRAIGDAPGRVMVATFASLVARVQQVVDAAERHGRKVSIVGPQHGGQRSTWPLNWDTCGCLPASCFPLTPPATCRRNRWCC